MSFLSTIFGWNIRAAREESRLKMGQLAWEKELRARKIAVVHEEKKLPITEAEIEKHLPFYVRHGLVVPKAGPEGEKFLAGLRAAAIKEAFFTRCRRRGVFLP